ncbi:MAG: NgoFVII family restriction endonuclease [Clostridiales bacterium]|nr:NgoFVII family restriction endonuclease [Clostridiales bacterium]NLL00262.1 NgoFVII family restriction endonuclease [Clostridiales bacterium]
MLSGLSSESDSPYINSRVAENTFCMVTGAENLGRADCSADARIGKIGIGVKTFLANNNYTLQKIAEFNRDAHMIRNKSAEKVVSIIARLRNERILSTMRIYGIDTMIYHCIVREPNLIRICESPMNLIDISNIRNIKEKNNKSTISFEDGKNEYSFNLNKNTLFMRFDTRESLLSIKVKILENPYNMLSRIMAYETDYKSGVSRDRYESVILPLFSNRGGRNVPKKSGLNQWNAAGRKRSNDEVYISIPAWIHRSYPKFFPKRDEPFALKLPNGNELSAKVCQDGSKALMTNPNAALGKWLLREVMNLKEGELLTYERLQILGIDSVEVCKITDKEYKIDFRPLGTYDEFLELHDNK